MKQTIGLAQFINAFQAMDREENFSSNGKKALFQYLEETERDTGEEMDLDVVALCCEYTEYDGVEEYADAYGLPYDFCPRCGDDLPESGYDCTECDGYVVDEAVIIEHICNHTSFIPVDADGFIIAGY